MVWIFSDVLGWWNIVRVIYFNNKGILTNKKISEGEVGITNQKNYVSNKNELVGSFRD